MHITFRPESRRIGAALAAVAGAAVLLSGCAITPVGGQVAYGATEASPSSSIASQTPSPTPTPATTSTSPTPEPEPVPVDPWETVSAKTMKTFKPCRKTVVGPGSSGKCAALVVKRLKAAGYYPWAKTSRISAVGVNAILNYQRSRGITPTGKVAKKTWLSLALREKAFKHDLPKKCFKSGVRICVDQGKRKLFWLKNGKVKKVVKVRLGGYTNHAKTGQWRVFPTANGTWKVFNKDANPVSKTYGSGAMPYSTMFHPDMYVHYSPGFHSVGYANSSHGCVNVGKLSDAIWIYKKTPIGTPVTVFTALKES